LKKRKREKPGVSLAAAVFLFIGLLLCVIQLKAENPLIIAERFLKGGGWIEIPLIALYGACIVYKMSNPATAARCRIISWTVFSIVFFTQLILGIIVSEKFLMTGKLHLPVPAMIISGPIYRGQFSVMTILFLSTVALTGPAWCSQLCYFGAIDGLAASFSTNRSTLNNKFRFKHTGLFLLIAGTILLRIAGVNTTISTLAGMIIGITGLLLILFLSRKKGKMMHCILYCPIGTMVNYLKYLNPFRLEIDMNCTFCGSCTPVCRYDALSLSDLKRKKPGRTCTLCGDCLAACPVNSIHYRLLRLGPELSRNIYLLLTVSIHSVFLALARI
jgi:ferredoxin-type protein NapH